MTKKSIIYILVIGQIFLWTGSAFMSVLYKLYNYYSPSAAYIISETWFYVMQAAGIGLFALLVSKKPGLAEKKSIALAALIATGVFTILALLIADGAFIVVSGLLMNLCIGVLSGIYLTRLATCIPQQCRGRVFAYAYAIGSIGTWLLSLLADGKLLQTSIVLYIYIGMLVLSLILTRLLEPIVDNDETADSGFVQMDRRLLLFAVLIPFLCSIVNGIGSFIPAAELSETLDPAFARIFYAVGLIAAGHINDKNRRAGAVCCIIALVFPFLSLALRDEVGISAFISIFSYVFYGLFSVYRVVLFTDLAGKCSAFTYLAVFGLMLGRVGDALGNFAGAKFASDTILVTCSTAAFFVACMLVFFALYQRLYVAHVTVTENTEVLVNRYEARYEMTSRQSEIFRLLLKGCSNTEISAELFLSESTVKFHIKNILKKTGCHNRTELIVKYKSGKW